MHGIINVYKEKGYTSHDVVAKLRGIIGQRKIGHTGTLDPDAVGVLPVCLGKATKLCDMLTDKSKTYEAVLLLGRTTDTQDVSGTTIEERSTQALLEEQVSRCIGEFVGNYAQIPPMYSALKVNGRKLYDLAREGIEVERKARPVYIHDIQIRRIELPRVTMEVSCSKGTYIRTLCQDIGEKLGCGGCMEALKRTRVGMFTIEEALRLEDIAKKKETGQLIDIIKPIDSMFLQYKAAHAKEEVTSLLHNGNSFECGYICNLEDIMPLEQVRVYDYQDNFIGIYRYEEQAKEFHIVKMFYEKDE